MIEGIAKQQLIKAGWYPGRKINISQYENVYEKYGYNFFPAARRFVEEYGDLYIEDSFYIDVYGKKRVLTHQSSTEAIQFTFPMPEEVRELVGRDIVPVAMLYHMETCMYISEDGKFYQNERVGGLAAENSDQLWNEYYGTVRGFATWEELKEGKGRTMFTQTVEQFI